MNDQTSPKPSNLCITTNGVGRIQVEGKSLPWLPPHGLVEITSDGRRREIRPDGSPGRYLD